ncbi:XVIPCD domain-containing protein [Luteibacter sp. 329MFSha]|uniref:XVIPCD domain-containing protein n=1 Tax=Luteibacter sp. 329MFSha TaxID=1798239 RepID=UPI0008C4908C|nr:XVIPCD domain-containing protein [Luteibacter sp. 329MFSha]SEV96695.1 putative chitinase [Luteibacter sp. 329MFSha]
MPQFNASSALLFKRFVEAGVTSPDELANVMGNASVETGSFTTMNEGLGYRSVEQVVGAVKSAGTRNTREEIQAAIDSGDPEQMAHILYDNRADLGNTNPGDGWVFHGRGYFQYTGRDNYEHFGQKFGVDLKNHPELAADPEMAAALAIAYWKDRVPEADRTDAYAAGFAINGGENGADARIDRSKLWATLITPELIQGVKEGSISLEQLQTMGNSPHKGAHHGHGTSLRLHDQSDAVGALQTQLGALGYTDGHGRPLAADHAFGPGTEAAVRQFQRDHQLTPDGVAGPVTLAAIQAAKAPAEAFAASNLLDARHPAHGMYEQAHACVARLDEQQGRAPGLMTQNFAGALTSAATAAGLNRVDHVVLNDDASRGWAVQGDLNSPFKKYTEVDVMQAIQTPLAQSSQEAAMHVQNGAQQQAMAQQQQTQQQDQAQQAAGPVMVR